MNVVLQIALFAAMLTPLAVSVWYVPKRLTALLRIERTRLLSVTWGLVVMASFPSFFLAASASRLAGLVYVAGGFILVAHTYLFFALLVFHALHRRLRLRDRSEAWAAIVVAAGFTAMGAWRADELDVTTREIEVPGLARDLTIMHIADVHLGHHRGGDFLGRVVSETRRRHPDLVLITGDLVDGNIALDPQTLAPLAEFGAPVYFTTGNHEAYVDTDRALRLIAAQGVRILHNEVVDTHTIQLVGLDYMNADDDAVDRDAAAKGSMAQELPKIPIADDMPVVLMHHSPIGVEPVAAHGIDLMLAGHTHAGQVFPGTVVAPLVFRLNRGLYAVEGMQVFVTQGAGTFGPRMRLGSSNEIDLLHLVPG